jgi:hypothetical protein
MRSAFKKNSVYDDDDDDDDKTCLLLPLFFFLSLCLFIQLFDYLFFFLLRACVEIILKKTNKES